MRLFVVIAAPPVITVSSPDGLTMIAAHPPRAFSVPFAEQAPSVTTVYRVWDTPDSLSLQREAGGEAEGSSSDDPNPTV
jgi:hypothetical protein